MYLDRRAGDILHRNTLTGILRKARRFLWDLEIPDKAVVDHHALGAVLAHALGLVHLDPVDQGGLRKRYNESTEYSPKNKRLQKSAYLNSFSGFV